MTQGPAIGVPPQTEAELLHRAEALSGRKIGELARLLAVDVPLDLRRHKGWVGEFVERLLGATAGSRAEPDFPHLGVELKTLPVDARGKPLESTFVCTIALGDMASLEFEKSPVWKKLRRVLFVPVEGLREKLVSERRVASPFLWSPTPDQTGQLKQDWEQAASMIAEGRTSEITGHAGVVLQVRPKAARGSSRRRALDEEGALYDEQPKGFYLRPAFTHELLRERFVLPVSV